MKRPVSKSKYETRLAKLLAGATLREILILVWSLDVIRSNNSKRQKYARLRYPKAAFGAQPGDEYFLAPWTLETLVNEALTHPSLSLKAKRRLNTREWGAAAELYNTLNNLENAESLDDIPELGMIDSISRIGWRQFGWQTGYWTRNRFFRAWSLYVFPEANHFFLKKHGISVERFCYTGFAVASQLVRNPAVSQDSSMSRIGIQDYERDAFFKLTALPNREARKRAKDLRKGKGQIAYKPSALRAYPLVTFNREGMRQAYCALPDLLYLRFSDGLFYDLVSNDDLRRHFGERFEKYTIQICRHYFKEPFSVLEEVSYGSKSKRIATPDVRIVQNGKLRVVIECKSRKLPYKVLSSPKPYQDNEAAYQDIVKGIVQVWRYAAHTRTGFSKENLTLASDCVGVVLTLEPWLQMSPQATGEVFDSAVEACSEIF